MGASPLNRGLGDVRSLLHDFPKEVPLSVKTFFRLLRCEKVVRRATDGPSRREDVHGPDHRTAEPERPGHVAVTGPALVVPDLAHPGVTSVRTVREGVRIRMGVPCISVDGRLASVRTTKEPARAKRRAGDPVFSSRPSAVARSSPEAKGGPTRGATPKPTPSRPLGASVLPAAACGEVGGASWLTRPRPLDATLTTPGLGRRR